MLTTRILNWIALFCLVGFFFPYLQRTKMPGSSETKLTLGVPYSPCLSVSWTDTEDKVEKNENGNITRSWHTRHSTAFNAELISWSSLLGIVGFVLLTASRRLRSKITSAPKT
jgi:hypothetical protein